MKSYMKNIYKILLASLLFPLAVACDTKYEIVDQLDFPRCMKPTQVKADVEYTNVTIDLRVFPDAEKYNIEFYNTEIPEEGEPLAADLFKSITVTTKEIPYTFAAPEEQTFYFRVQALNEKKLASHWSAPAKFTTTTDPATVCTKPDGIEVKVIGNKKVNFKWSTYPDTKFYVLEIYSKAIPSTGEPDAADLVKATNIDVDKVPFDLTLDAYGKYYYRVKASNPESVRRDSKWASGSIEVEAFVWPTDPTAITESFTSSKPSVSPDMSGLASGAELATDIVFEKIIYAKGCKYYGDRVSMSGKPTMDSSGQLPTNRHVRFKVNVPGSFSFVPRCSSVDKKLTITVVTNKPDEGEILTTIYDEVFDINLSPSSGGTPLTFTIPEDVLYGITEAATVYVWSSNGGGQQVYPITWTKAE